MIIKLERYNEVGELPIENRTTGLQPHVHYKDGDQRVSVTGVAVRMEEKGAVMRIGQRDAYNWSPSRE